jgi:hypothetical protein
MKRTHNEDNFDLLEDEKPVSRRGWHGRTRVRRGRQQDGDRALRDFFLSTAQDPEATWPYKMDKSRGYEENRLITGIKLANLRIYEHQQREPKLRGMGTTIVAILIIDEGVLVAHVGDSRVYRMRQGKLEQLTEDHSLLNDYIKMKRLSEEEIANFPHKNVIVRALGMKDTVKVDTRLERTAGRRHVPPLLGRSLGPGHRRRDPRDRVLDAGSQARRLAPHRARERQRRPRQRHRGLRQVDGPRLSCSPF